METVPARLLISLGLVVSSAALARGQVTFGTPEQTFAGATKSAQVLETDIAVGFDQVMAVWIDHVPGSFARVGWSMRSASSGAGTWTDGVIDRFAMPDPLYTDIQGAPIDRFDAFTDPSVAYSPAANGLPACFMACALAYQAATGGAAGGYSCVVVSFFEPASPSPHWSDWIIVDCVSSAVFEGMPPFVTLDKPFLVAGAPNEFYVTHMSSDGTIHYRYTRTDNGGRTTVSNGGWLAGTDVLVNGSPVYGFFAMQPSTAAASDLFCAFNSGGALTTTKFHFLRGVDAPGMQVNFTSLDTLAGTPVELVWASKADSKLPGTFTSGTVAQPAVDPTNSNHLYVVGTRVENGNDVDVVFNELVRNPGGDWQVRYATDRVVHDDPPPPTTHCETTQTNSTDQWSPAVVVDHLGRIHIVFYDDRNYDQKDGAPAAGCPQPRFDLNYSLSVDGGLTFRHFPRSAPAGQAAWMDFGPDSTGIPYPGPREYLGVEYVRGSDRSYVWAGLSGHDTLTGVSPFSMIWAQAIEVK